MSDREGGSPELPPLRGAARKAALVWLSLVVLLYVTVRELGLVCVP